MRRVLLVLVVAMVGCEGVATNVDAGALADAGATFDAGSSVDAGLISDAGLINDAGVITDAGVMVDAGQLIDAGAIADAGVIDAGLIIDAGSRIDAGPTLDAGRSADGGRYSIDFTTATVENPLSAGGVWTNNTQGTGGNAPPGNLTSMRVGLASDGQTLIAFGTHGGIDYDDSFAFVPGFTGDQFIEAVIYKEPGYNPNASGSNHELELLLGCSSDAGVRTWNEFLFNSGGGVDILYLSGGPSDFTGIANVNASAAPIPADGDVVRATRVGNVLSLYINGVLVAGYDGSNPARVAHGSGIGIAAFVRPGATLNKYGFRRVTMGTLP